MKRRARKSLAIPPRTVPPWFLRRFGRIEPETALRVAEYVQENAVDRLRGKSVDGALEEIAASFGYRKSRGYEILRAGRFLLWRRIKSEKD